MTQRAAHRTETICIGCLRDYRPARTHVRRGASRFCSNCRASNGEPKFAQRLDATTDATTALALIDALGFWLDA